MQRRADAALLPLATLALVVSGAGTSGAGAQPALRGTGLIPAVHPVEIEGASALAHFRDALRALERDPRRRVRVLHYGDSNVAADLWTAVARATLQARFGDGGSGYLLPPPHGSWHRGSVQLRAEGVWRSRRRGFGRDFGPGDGLWGLAGVGIEPRDAGARLVAQVPAAAAERTLELHLLGRARPGGALSVTIDRAPAERVATHLDAPGLVLRRWTLDAGAHRVQIRHAGGQPRVLGVVVEGTSGVVYDVLGINGHRASAINHWDVPLVRAQLTHRAPDLVVLSYGGNEALDPHLSLTIYEERTRAAIRTIRELTPGASCLLVGPVATMETYAPRMRAVAEVQRRLGDELGCAFWDAAQTSGGPGTLRRWTRYPRMVAGDRLHLGPDGYARVGREFVTALLRGL